MKIIQTEMVLPSFRRGFHLITRLVEEHIATELRQIEKGQLQVFIKHTSAALTINENADPTVRADFETHFNRMVPADAPYRHDYEGDDDMPAHLKASLLGCSLTIPVTRGKLNLGTWQGIYLCEHRDHGGDRTLVLTAIGM